MEMVPGIKEGGNIHLMCGIGPDCALQVIQVAQLSIIAVAVSSFIDGIYDELQAHGALPRIGPVNAFFV